MEVQIKYTENKTLQPELFLASTDYSNDEKIELILATETKLVSLVAGENTEPEFKLIIFQTNDNEVLKNCPLC